MKRLSTISLALVVVLLMSGSAFARHRHHRGQFHSGVIVGPPVVHYYAPPGFYPYQAPPRFYYRPPSHFHGHDGYRGWVPGYRDWRRSHHGWKGGWKAWERGWSPGRHWR